VAGLQVTSSPQGQEIQMKSVDQLLDQLVTQIEDAEYSDARETADDLVRLLAGKYGALIEVKSDALESVVRELESQLGHRLR
jgi:hypothetical protein